MTAHTPGPWTLDTVANGWMLVANGQDITAEAFDATEADARLIAAAPELLEALQSLTRALAEAGLDTMPGDTMADVRTASEDALATIAKAEGRAA